MANETIAGALRARILEVIPTLNVYRLEAPVGAELPLVVITDPVSTAIEELGDISVLDDEIQIDLYTEYGDYNITLADSIHNALHRANLDILGVNVYRCSVTGRLNNVGEDDTLSGVNRVTFTVIVKRLLKS